MEDFITTRVADYGYLAVFVLMAVGSACVPIPSEIVMLFGGALASAGFAAPGKDLDLVLVSLVGVAGNLAGSWAAYAVGYAGGRPLVERWGRYVLLRPHELDRAHVWFERHGEAAVFFFRLVPLARAFISLPAGAARMSFGRFTFYTFLGVLPWCFGLAGAGYLLGESWDSIDNYIRPISYALGAILVLALAVWVIRRLRNRERA
jgi:membrane protein DedA with SNARE-associated domain